MIRRTYGQVKSVLAETAGQTGMPVDDARLLSYVNLAIEELMNEGDWPGVVDRWYFDFNEATSLLTLPFFLDRLMQVTVDDVPREIRSPWYEFVQYGPGIQRESDALRTDRRSWVSVVMDRGTYPTRYDIPDADGPWTLEVQSQVDEDATAQMNVQGFDPDQKVIRTQDISDGTAGDWYDGVNLSIGTSGDSSLQEFASITSVVKPQTNGYVDLIASNGSTSLTL